MKLDEDGYLRSKDTVALIRSKFGDAWSTKNIKRMDTNDWFEAEDHDEYSRMFTTKIFKKYSPSVF